jgi:hypothetical protein
MYNFRRNIIYMACPCCVNGKNASVISPFPIIFIAIGISGIGDYNFAGLVQSFCLVDDIFALLGFAEFAVLI